MCAVDQSHGGVSSGSHGKHDAGAVVLVDPTAKAHGCALANGPANDAVFEANWQSGNVFSGQSPYVQHRLIVAAYGDFHNQPVMEQQHAQVAGPVRKALAVMRRRQRDYFTELFRSFAVPLPTASDSPATTLSCCLLNFIN